VSFLLCSFILIKMLKSGHLTNFVVVHAVWVILMFVNICTVISISEVQVPCFASFVTPT
jgi:hypothetical protein